MNNYNCDILILGGGAAGLTAAISAAKNGAKNIIIAEKNARVGKKIAVTGNGRCNITNKNLHKENYHGDSDFAMSFIEKFGFKETVEFFKEIGVIIKTEESGKAYPYSLQAASVVDALRFECDALNVKTITECEILKINKTNDGFIVNSNDYEFSTKAIILAFGGMGGGALYGTDGSAFKLLPDFKKIEQKPVIVQIKTENKITRALKGIKVNAKVTVNGKSDLGEVLFCDYGLSGPPILQLSRYCNNGDTIKLDLMPEYSIDEVIKLLTLRQALIREEKEFFTGLLNKRVGMEIIKLCGGIYDLNKLAKTIKAFSFTVTGNTGFKNAQATSGGIDTKEFKDNLESKKIPMLFAAGELLNVDGDCGGYNLQWAFSSGIIAGKNAALKIKG